MKHLRNTWYVAGFADEIEQGKLLARTLLDEPVVLFRDAGGTVKALVDRCSHRFAPLSMGKLCDNGATLQCGYHGLRFDGSGQCLHNPHGNGLISPMSRVKAYAVVERHGMVWWWAGDAKQADAASIPDDSFLLEASKHVTLRGYLPTQCDYELLSDNILDLTHADYLHVGTLGNGSLSRARPEVEDVDPRCTRVSWRSSADVAPGAFDRHLPNPGQPSEQWTEVTWTAPCHMHLRVGASQGEGVGGSVEARTIHTATPETAGRCHYWYWSVRNFDANPEANAFVTKMIAHAFTQEDKPMLEAQQRRMGSAEFWSLKPALLAGDAGAARVRRKLVGLIAAEEAEEIAAPADVVRQVRA